jgi:DNA-binding transcriptional regulator YiaG
MTEGYHYTGCGLDYVYLLDGYEVRETPHGRAVAIQDARGLHEAIARMIISSPAPLRGQEVRFLRAQLKLAQEGLARALRTKRGSVARWEAKPGRPIPGTADSALRMFYALKAEKHEVAERLVELLTEIDNLEHKIAVMRDETFKTTVAGWEREKEAA